MQHVVLPLWTGVDAHCLFHPVSSSIPRKGTVLLLHGFPDTNWGWRHLLAPISSMGYDCYAPRMRGYGPRDVLEQDDELRMELICDDVCAIMDALMVRSCVVIGHDWGGTAAWNFAAHFPQRTLAVASFCTPFFTVPKTNPWPKIIANPGRFAYQMFFQTKEAQVLLESNVKMAVRLMIRASTDEPVAPGADSRFLQTMAFGAVNGMNGLPSDAQSELPPLATPRSKMLTESDEAIYVRQFSESGFENALRWYRNVENNWKWNSKIAGVKITCPALMVTAGKDYVLAPSMVAGMNLHMDRLDIRHVEEASHWIMQEQPEQCARILQQWLKSLDGVVVAAKL